jgi:hypothetical protein
MKVVKTGIMKNLYIAGTKKTPGMIFNTNGKLLVWGRSLPFQTDSEEDEYFVPLKKQMDEFCLEPATTLNISIGIEYITGMPGKRLLEILLKAKSLKENNCNVTVDWYYMKDDDDIKERGEDLSLILNLGFNFFEVEDLYSYFLTLAQSSY